MSRISVGALIEKLSQYDKNMTVYIPMSAGGSLVVEARDLVYEGKGETVVGIYNDNGGRFGHDVLTEEEYKERSLEFLDGLLDIERSHRFGHSFKRFTTIHGDYRIYSDFGEQASCYGTTYDDRIIQRMVDEGLLEFYKEPFSRDGVKITNKGREYFETTRQKGE